MTAARAGRSFRVMSLRSIILIVWGAFWVYWLVSAVGSKEGVRNTNWRPRGLIAVVAIVATRVFSPHALAIHSVPVKVVGVIVFAAGLCLAVWARIYLGRNWGMPMTQKREPELVTSGPYGFVRHPIYSGILLGFAGTALATNGYWLIVFAVCLVYFLYSARVEEGIMSTTFPATYPGYRARTKMLIPFVL
jgi:protein-S-isoprenylcysteine O-methyltransferase Ste14